MSRTFTILALFAATCISGTFAADNSIGTWKLNVAKSTYNPGPMPVKTLTTTREPADGGVKVNSFGERVDGLPIHVTYTAKYDGSQTYVNGSGAPYDRIAIKQVDANTFTDERWDGSSYNVTGRMVVSKDGKTLTWTSKGTNADGKPVSSTFVFDKQ